MSHSCTQQSCPCETESSRGPEHDTPLVYPNSLTSTGRYESKVACLRGSSSPQRPGQKDHGYREKGLSFQSTGRSLLLPLYPNWTLEEGPLGWTWLPEVLAVIWGSFFTMKDVYEGQAVGWEVIATSLSLPSLSAPEIPAGFYGYIRL